MTALGRPLERDPYCRHCRLIPDSIIGTPCWEWTGYIRNGYGRCRLDDKMMAAHRVAYILFVEDLGKGVPLAKGVPLDHWCRNPLCVNPEHLSVCDNRANSERGLLGVMRHRECSNGRYKHSPNYRYSSS